MAGDTRGIQGSSFLSKLKATDPSSSGGESCQNPPEMEPIQESLLTASEVQGGLPAASEQGSVWLGGGGFLEVDAEGRPLVMTRPKPLGLLPIPQEVERIVAKEDARLLQEHGIVPTPEARRRMMDSLTLQYYYEGFDVAYRRTSRGVEVLAVGHDDIGRLLRGRDEGPRREIKVGQP